MSYIGNSPGVTKRQLFRYIATAGQSLFSGLDVNSLTLNYVPGLEDVFLNGLYIPAANYIASNGSTIIFSESLSAGDEVQILSNSPFNPADTLNKSSNGADILNKFTFRRSIQSPMASKLTGYLVNPAFAVSQQNGTNVVSVSTNNLSTYITDQWITSKNGSVVLSGQAVSGNLSSVATMRGFTTGSTTTTTTSQSSFSTFEFSQAFVQMIEGTHIRELGWGTADAKSVDIVFIITATVAGTYSLSIRSSNADRSYVTTFALAANTPTLVYKTIPGPVTGTWPTTNTNAAQITIGAVSGTGLQAPSLDVWNTGNYISSSTTTNWNSSTNSTVTLNFCNMYQNGVIPYSETSTAGLLDILNGLKKSFDDEVKSCQRYFQWIPMNLQFYSPAFGAEFTDTIMFPANMRVAPTIGSMVTDPDCTGSGSEIVQADSYTVTNWSIRHATIAVTSNVSSSVTKIIGYRWPAIARL